MSRLKQDKNWIYPSAYLIPSLFTHPQAQSFRLKPPAWKSWLPTRREAIVLGTLALLSSLLPIQGLLIDQRQSIQANYQTITAQTIRSQTPPVLLVQVDEQTLRNVQVINQNLDRQYLAKLVNRATQLNLSTIGLDYLLFRPQPQGDPVLAQALKIAGEKGTKFILAATLEQFSNSTNWSRVLPEIAAPQQPWYTDGDIDLLGDPPFYARVIGDTNAQPEVLPMAYALVKEKAKLREDNRFWLHPVSRFAEKIGQMWLRPLIDFTVPPDRVYQAISAREFLNKNQQHDLQKAIANQPLALIAAGGQIDAGVTPGEDNFTSPAAFQHASNRLKITGGEVHAYLVHNLMHHRLIIPIPDIWMLGLASLLGKGSALWLARQNQKSRRAMWLLGIPLLYTVASLQAYVWCAVLLPVLFPIVTYLTYVVPFIRKRDRHA